MPKGVEHYQTQQQGEILLGVESLMPKGVEHASREFYQRTRPFGVESLMPKGVEHETARLDLKVFRMCVESLMPKGVEHGAIAESTHITNKCRISDAERR